MLAALCPLQAAANSAKCKQWSYRPADRACRLFIDNQGQNQASVALLNTNAYQGNWTSGMSEWEAMNPALLAR
jgi:hypothetical protein